VSSGTSDVVVEKDYLEQCLTWVSAGSRHVIIPCDRCFCSSSLCSWTLDQEQTFSQDALNLAESSAEGQGDADIDAVRTIKRP
jgi:hypothetical protein